MRVECPELLEKVHPIRADYSAIDLDIDAADRAMLSSQVQVSCRCCDAEAPHAKYCILSGFVGFCCCICCCLRLLAIQSMDFCVKLLCVTVTVDV